MRNADLIHKVLIENVNFWVLVGVFVAFNSRFCHIFEGLEHHVLSDSVHRFSQHGIHSKEEKLINFIDSVHFNLIQPKKLFYNVVHFVFNPARPHNLLPLFYCFVLFLFQSIPETFIHRIQMLIELGFCIGHLYHIWIFFYEFIQVFLEIQYLKIFVIWLLDNTKEFILKLNTARVDNFPVFVEFH